MYVQPIVPTISDNDEQAMARLKSWLQDEFTKLAQSLGTPGALKTVAVLYNAASPTTISSAYTPLSNYAQGGSTDNFNSSGGSYDLATGKIILPGSGQSYYSITGLVNIDGITNKGFDAAFYIESKDEGYLLIDTEYVNTGQRQNYFSMNATLAGPLTSGDELTIGITYGATDTGITLNNSMFMVEQIT